MKILLYSFFLNDYTVLLPYWLQHTANNFYPENTDVLVVTDDENISIPNDKIKIKVIPKQKFRNIFLWQKNATHKEIIDEYKDKYDLFVHLQSNCFLTQKIDETNFPIDSSKLTVFTHTAIDVPYVMWEQNICKMGSNGYRSLGSYQNTYVHSGMLFGNYDVLNQMFIDCHNMYLKDKSNNKLHKVPYHDESYLNSWVVDNRNKVNILERIDSGEYDTFLNFKYKQFFLVDKHTLGVMKNKYVIPKFVSNSRFGNWLFLIAACYAHCLRNGYDLRIPYEKPLLNKLIVEKFNSPQYIDSTDKPTFNETTYHYSPIPKDHVGFISGFFQSSKYFSDFEEEIKELFGELVSENKTENTAAIHVRMGDYLKFSYRYKSPTKDFIEKAISKLSPNISKLVVCSDEIYKAIELVKSCKGVEKLTIIPRHGNEIEDIRTLTSCEEFIMSCSSFSWWAAYLGEHKKVIVDKKWYNDNQLKEDDIYEKSWIKI